MICCQKMNEIEQALQLAATGTCSVHDGSHLFLNHAFEIFARHEKFHMALSGLGNIRKAISCYDKLSEMSEKNWSYCDELVSLLLIQGKDRSA